jgi:hypothetical protein
LTHHDWLNFKNPKAPAARREAEEDWGRRRLGLSALASYPLPGAIFSAHADPAISPAAEFFLDAGATTRIDKGAMNTGP